MVVYKHSLREPLAQGFLTPANEQRRESLFSCRPTDAGASFAYRQRVLTRIARSAGFCESLGQVLLTSTNEERHESLAFMPSECSRGKRFVYPSVVLHSISTFPFSLEELLFLLHPLGT